MHSQVPQYLDVEDKIIGPLTLKQFIYLLIGGGVIFLLYSFLKLPIFIIAAIPIAFFTLLLAFYRIGNQKFPQFIVNLLGFISKPNIYTWKKLPPKKPSEEPTPKIIKKMGVSKQLPKESGLKELWWKVEISKPKPTKGE